MQLGLLQHGYHTFSQSSVGTLSYSILVGLIAHSVLPGNSSIQEELVQLIGHVLATLVIPETLDAHIELVLCLSLETLEGIRDITLQTQWHHSKEAAVVINEGDPVPEAFFGGDLK